MQTQHLNLQALKTGKFHSSLDLLCTITIEAINTCGFTGTFIYNGLLHRWHTGLSCEQYMHKEISNAYSLPSHSTKKAFLSLYKIISYYYYMGI